MRVLRARLEPPGHQVAPATRASRRTPAATTATATINGPAFPALSLDHPRFFLDRYILPRLNSKLTGRLTAPRPRHPGHRPNHAGGQRKRWALALDGNHRVKVSWHDAARGSSSAMIRRKRARRSCRRRELSLEVASTQVELEKQLADARAQALDDSAPAQQPADRGPRRTRPGGARAQCRTPPAAAPQALDAHRKTDRGCRHHPRHARSGVVAAAGGIRHLCAGGRGDPLDHTCGCVIEARTRRG